MDKNLVAVRLGAATAKLYQALAEILESSGSEQASAAIRSVLLNVLCGSYHDFRSGLLLPKGDLIEALRAVPHHQSAVDAIADLITRVVCGDFADDSSEARRWAAKFGTARTIASRQPETRCAVILSDYERLVHTWLYRYVEVYGVSPQVKEISEGTGMRSITVSGHLRRIESKGAAVNLGGLRGWLPTRSP